MLYKKFYDNFKILDMIWMKNGRMGYIKKNFQWNFVFYKNGYKKNTSTKKHINW